MYPDSDSRDVSARDRLYGHATASSEGRRNFVVVLLTVSIFLLVVSVSCRQATAPGPARNILEAGLVTLTDLDQLKKIIRDKSKGKTIELPDEEKEPAPVPDLMEALERTLAEVKG